MEAKYPIGYKKNAIAFALAATRLCNVRLVFDYLRMTQNSSACALRDENKFTALFLSTKLHGSLFMSMCGSIPLSVKVHTIQDLILFLTGSRVLLIRSVTSLMRIKRKNLPGTSKGWIDTAHSGPSQQWVLGLFSDGTLKSLLKKSAPILVLKLNGNGPILQ